MIPLGQILGRRKEIRHRAHNRGERHSNDAPEHALSALRQTLWRGAARQKENHDVNYRTAIIAILLAAGFGAAHAQDNAAKQPAMAKPVQARPVQRVKPKEPAKDATFHGKEAHVYFREKELIWKIGNGVIERTIQFDKDLGGLHTTQIKTMDGVPKIDTVSTTEGEFSVVGADGQKRGPYRLDRDWAYIWQSVGTPVHEGRLLTIHLQGVRSNSGIEVEVLYEIYPGNRPYLAKSLTLINRGEAPIALADVVYDRWVLPTPDRPLRQGLKTTTSVSNAKPEDFSAGGDFSLGVEDAANRIGMRAFLAGKNGEISYQHGAVTPRFTGPVEAARRGGRAYSPFAVVFAYFGGPDRGNLLYQKYDIAGAPTAAYVKSRNP